MWPELVTLKDGLLLLDTDNEEEETALDTDDEVEETALNVTIEVEVLVKLLLLVGLTTPLLKLLPVGDVEEYGIAVEAAVTTELLGDNDVMDMVEVVVVVEVLDTAVLAVEEEDGLIVI